MKRAFGDFLMVVGIVMSMYIFSSYNIYTVSESASSAGTFAFYFFFIIAALIVICGIALRKTIENATA